MNDSNTNDNDTRIYVCKAGTCRSKGSDAVLVEIEELGNLVGGCRAEPTGCLGYCSQGPAVAVASRQRRGKAIIHVAINSFEKSARVVQDATGTKPSLDNLPPKTASRLNRMRQQRAREYAVATYQWNKALASLEGQQDDFDEELHDEQQRVLQKAGYPMGIPAPSTTFHASTMPPVIANYVPWTILSVDVVSAHSAIFRLACSDRKRGTPHPRGRGRLVKPKTWHTTMLGLIGPNSEGPLPWLERDYTPISTALEWDRGQCDILIKIYKDGLLTSWLQRHCRNDNPGDTKVWLSQPIQTLSSPSLTPDGDGFAPASVLLVLAGTGVVALPQVLTHKDPMRKLGISVPRSKQLPLACPIDVILSCREDDILMLPELKEWCQQATRSGEGVRNGLLLLTPLNNPQGPPPFEEEWKPIEADSVEEFVKDVSNLQIKRGQRLNQDIMARALGRMKQPCRVVVSGPDSFNNAAREYLEACGLDTSTQLTVLAA